MATLQANGGALYIRETLTKKKAYCANGKVLCNDGGGWKTYAKVKAGHTVQEAIAKQQESERTMPFRYPAWFAFRKRFHEIVSFKSRFMVLEAIKLMPDDPDGVWSELQDSWDMPKLDVEECCELCKLYKELEKEREETRIALRAY